MFQRYASKMIVLVILFSLNFVNGHEKHNYFLDNKIVLSRSSSTFKNTLKYTNYAGTICSLGMAIYMAFKPVEAGEGFVYFLGDAGLNAVSAFVDPERSPKKAIGLGMSNILFSWISSVVLSKVLKDLILPMDGPIMAFYIGFQGIKYAITAGYQLVIAAKTLKNGKQ